MEYSIIVVVVVEEDSKLGGGGWVAEEGGLAGRGRVGELWVKSDFRVWGFRGDWGDWS